MGSGSSRKYNKHRANAEAYNRPGHNQRRQRPARQPIQIQPGASVARRHHPHHPHHAQHHQNYHRHHRHPSYYPFNYESPVPMYLNSNPLRGPVMNNYPPWLYQQTPSPMAYPLQSQYPYQRPIVPQYPSQSPVPYTQLLRETPPIVEPMPSYGYEPQRSAWPPYGQSSMPVYSPAQYNAAGQSGMNGVQQNNYNQLYQTGPRNLNTDWTGGGVNSPGFLGPPL